VDSKVEHIPINLSFESESLENAKKLLISISGGVIIDFSVIDKDYIKVKKGNKIYEIWNIKDKEHEIVSIYENDKLIVDIIGEPESPAHKIIHYSIQQLFKSIEQEINKYLVNLKGNITIKT